LATQRSDNHYEEAHMSRIATLTAVLTMAVAPTAFAGQDLRSPDVRDIATPAVVDLRSPDAADPVQVTGLDLRSPDARDVFVPPTPVTAAEPASSDTPVWGVIALIMAALAAGAALVVMLRRHRQVGRPVGV
jgi:hypothetical protein